VTSDQDTPETPPRWRAGPIGWIVLGLLLWGGFLAVGSYANGRTLPWSRGLIVFGTTVTFVVFWLVMLEWRKWRLRRESEDAQ
jgi:protein-S-isoprenylcysteine O-methyltransferase Ste14